LKRFPSIACGRRSMLLALRSPKWPKTSRRHHDDLLSGNAITQRS